jgi:hypothetical protein
VPEARKEIGSGGNGQLQSPVKDELKSNRGYLLVAMVYIGLRVNIHLITKAMNMKEMKDDRDQRKVKIR